MKPFRDVVRRLDDGSRMSREVHVRFCEGLGLQCPGLLTQRMREFLDHNGRTLGRTAAAHRAVFIAEQLPKDFIAQLQAAAEAFRAAAAERQVYWATKAAATRGVADALRERRKVLPIVNALVVKALAGKAD